MEFTLGILGLLYLCSPLLVWILVHRHWKKVGNDPAIEQAPIIPQYEPFQNLPPALIGVVYDNQANNYDLTATLLDFVAKKIIRLDNNSQIEERWNGKLKNYHTVDYQLTLLQPTALQDSKLQPYERLILKTIFADQQLMVLTEAIQQLAKAAPIIRKQLYQDAVQVGLFTLVADHWRRTYQRVSHWLMIIGFITGFVGIGIPILTSGFIFRVYSRWMSQRTPLGMQAIHWCEGFKLYLYRAERFRSQRMAIELAEHVLPYVIVLRLQIPAWQLELPATIKHLAETKI